MGRHRAEATTAQDEDPGAVEQIANVTVRSPWFVIGLIALIGLLIAVLYVRDSRAQTDTLQDQAAVLAAQQEQIIKLGKAANEQRKLILDCTTPGGKCFERGQAQQAQIIGNPEAPINDVAVAAAACAAKLGLAATQDTVMSCTVAALGLKP